MAELSRLGLIISNGGGQFDGVAIHLRISVLNNELSFIRKCSTSGFHDYSLNLELNEAILVYFVFCGKYSVICLIFIFIYDWLVLFEDISRKKRGGKSYPIPSH